MRMRVIEASRTWRRASRCRRVLVPLWSVVIVTALVAGGCAKKVVAKTTPDVPPLEIPVPPPRVLAPAGEPIPTVPAEAPPPPARPPARPPAKTDAPRPEAARSEPPESAAPRSPSDAPARSLQTTPSVSEDAAARGVRDVLARTARDLGQVNPASLGADARSQYETARRFVQQAEDALKDRNVVFARTLADKAATLAAVLLDR